MNKFLITSFLLIWGNIIYTGNSIYICKRISAAQANNHQIKVTMAVGTSEEGHTQRIFTATLEKFYYIKTITFFVTDRNDNAVFNVHVWAGTNAEGNILHRLENQVTCFEQLEIIKYLNKFKNTQEIEKDYFMLRGSKNFQL